MKYIKLDDIDSYRIAFVMSNKVWKLAIKWDSFVKSTIRKQFVNSVDSISANIAEGFGRFHKKEKIRFYVIARGSVLESIDWLNKLLVREIITKEDYHMIIKDLDELPKSINSLIKYTEMKLKY